MTTCSSQSLSLAKHIGFSLFNPHVAPMYHVSLCFKGGGKKSIMKVKTIDKHWNQNYLTIRLQHKIPSSNKPKAENKIISKSQTAPLPPVQQSIRHYPVYRSGSQVTISRLQSRQRQDGRIALNRLPAQRRNLRHLGTSQGEAWAARPVLRANVITPSNEIIH